MFILQIMRLHQKNSRTSLSKLSNTAIGIPTHVLTQVVCVWLTNRIGKQPTPNTFGTFIQLTYQETVNWMVCYISQIWATSKQYQCRMSTKKKNDKPKLAQILNTHTYGYFTCGPLQDHIHFVQARRRPAVPTVAHFRNFKTVYLCLLAQ